MQGGFPVPPWVTFPQAPLSSRTAGFPEFGLYRSWQVAASPCWMWALPDVISAVCPWALGPVPRRDLPVRLLVSSRSTSASHHGIGVRLAKWSLQGSFHRGALSGLQSFAYVQAPMLARPPGCFHRCGSKSIRAAGPFTPRNGPVVTDRNCGIATRLNRATGAAGLSPARLRPCRPLQCHPAPPAQVPLLPSPGSHLPTWDLEEEDQGEGGQGEE